MPIDLSLSENPLGCSTQVPIVLKTLNQQDLFDYPDPDCNELKQMIAKRSKLSLDNILVANGSEALIKLIPQVLLADRDEVIIPKLTFPMFAIASKLAKGKVVLSNMTPELDIDLKDLNSKITRKTRLIFICNPNNPTGKVLSKANLIQLINSTKSTVLIDEANIEFGGETFIEEVKNLKNLIILRTFSKGYGLAGLRIGFCAAGKEIIEVLKQTTQPFPVSSIAQKAAIVAISDIKFLRITKLFMREERKFLTEELTNRGLQVIRSQTNNLLVKTPFSSTEFVRKLNDQGVSVVDGSFFNLANENFIRVSPRLRKTNLLFLKAIDKIFNEEV